MKTEKFASLNKVLLVLGQRTGAHHETNEYPILPRVKKRGDMIVPLG